MTKAQPEWTKERLNTLFLTNDRAVERAILFLYDRQTESEKRSGARRRTTGAGSADWTGGSFPALASACAWA